MNTSSDSLRLEKLSVGYRDRLVLKDVNATLPAGRLTCLVGRNGAGKSTILKTLCGFINPIEGRVLLDNTDIRSIPPHRLAEKIAIVLTRRPAALNMTVEDLVALGRTPYSSILGSLRDNDRLIVDEAMRKVGLDDDKRKRRVATLSDGELQKALIAKALAQQTDVILLDEATAFLDYNAKAEILELLADIAHSQNKIVLLSTHDLDLAFQLTDDLWLIHNEKLLTGTPSTLLHLGVLAQAFPYAASRL